jgi:ribosome maturation factor RimP
MISKKTVAALIKERIEELDNGLFIVSLNISTGNIINVEIDKYEGNVSVMDCMSVSRNVEHNLDREEQDFELHVSSAGLDRGLRVLPQYRKNIGRQVKIKLHDGKSYEGELIDAQHENCTIQTVRKEKVEGKKKKEEIIENHTFEMTQVKETKIVISFK